MTTNTIRLALAAGTTAALLAGSPARADHGTFDGSDPDRGNHIEPGDWGDLPISDESIRSSLLIHLAREQIALSAEWLGPGPYDLAPIIDGTNPDWDNELRAEVHAMGLTKHHHGIAGLISRFNGNGWPDIEQWFAPSAGIDVGDDFQGYGGRGHTVLNLWPVVQTANGPVGEIPYTFSDNMMGAWVNRFVTDDAIEVNAINGVANALAVMLILEQELPVRFVGFNPTIHNTVGSLIFESIGNGTPTANPPTNNSVNRIGRAPAADDFAGNPQPPTQMTHNSWQNFPSMIRSLGFVLGLDWEQRHPARDVFIEVHPENLPPVGFPSFVAPADGINGPGLTDTPNSTGPLFWEQTLQPTNVPEDVTCGQFGFDLDSIMLIGPFDYTTIGPSHTIRDPYRYVDYNGDGTVDTTPGGADDRMFSQPLPVFFSDCDLAALTVTYTNEIPWFYGDDETCPYDINGDNVQDGIDAGLFLDLWTARDPSADLVPPFGTVDDDDLAVFNGEILFVGVDAFVVQSCVGGADDDLPPDFGWFYGKNPLCPHDVNEDDVQNGEDSNAFSILHAAGDPAADLVPPFGEINDDDYDAFFDGQPPYTVPFLLFDCVNEPDVLGWYYGKNPTCPHDVNEDLIQSVQDIIEFDALWDAGSFAADLVPPFGQLTIEDKQAFRFGDAANNIDAFTPGFCSDNGPPGPGTRPGLSNPG